VAMSPCTRPGRTHRQHLRRLIYPIVIALITLIVGLIFLRETNTTKIYEEIGVAPTGADV
jgi:hypothetical protein